MMPVDEALKFAAGLPAKKLSTAEQRIDSRALFSLEAEVERLRKCLAKANANMERSERDLYLKLGETEKEVERLNKNGAEAWATVASLRAELALVKDQEVRTAKLCAEQDDALEKLQVENAELLANGQRQLTYAASVQAELDWFSRWHSLSKVVVDSVCDARGLTELLDWEAENPKPEVSK